MANTREMTILICTFVVSVIGTSIIGTGRVNAQGSGNALDFDGRHCKEKLCDDYAIASLDGTSLTNLTVEMWIKQVASASDGIFQWAHVLDSETPFVYFEDLNGVFQLFVDGDYRITTTILEDTWHHFAVTYDGTNWILYRDGVSIGTYIGGTEFQTFAQSVYFAQGLRGYWGGTIDEARFWNIARTETQIRDNMCKKLTGGETGLVAYYRMDGTSGTTVIDAVGSNDGTMINMDPATDRIPSGAPIGDASANDYTGTIALTNVLTSEGGGITVDNISGSPDGVQAYRVDEAPNVTTAPNGLITLTTERYFGVFVVGGSTPTYDFTLDYSGYGGITDENGLELAKRDDNSDDTWTDANATLNTTANTLKLTGESGTEYILGSSVSDNPLPVKLSSLTASVEDEEVNLYWVTQSEINNAGFEVWRSSVEDTIYQLLSTYLYNSDLKGQGNSSTSQEYFYRDESVQEGITYHYQVADVDYNGSKTFHGPISVTVTTLPLESKLYQNYPNPFNPSTLISFELPQREHLILKIYNVLGQEVKTLINDIKPPGLTSVVWDGTNNLGHKVNSGIYTYSLRVGDAAWSKKMTLLR